MKTFGIKETVQEQAVSIMTSQKNVQHCFQIHICAKKYVYFK